MDSETVLKCNVCEKEQLISLISGILVCPVCDARPVTPKEPQPPPPTWVKKLGGIDPTDSTFKD